MSNTWRIGTDKEPMGAYCIGTLCLDKPGHTAKISIHGDDRKQIGEDLCEFLNILEDVDDAEEMAVYSLPNPDTPDTHRLSSIEYFKKIVISMLAGDPDALELCSDHIANMLSTIEFVSGPEEFNTFYNTIVWQYGYKPPTRIDDTTYHGANESPEKYKIGDEIVVWWKTGKIVDGKNIGTILKVEVSEKPSYDYNYILTVTSTTPRGYTEMMAI